MFSEIKAFKMRVRTNDAGRFATSGPPQELDAKRLVYIYIYIYLFNLLISNMQTTGKGLSNSATDTGIYNNIRVPRFTGSMLCLSLPVYQVKLDWLPLPCIALIQPSQLSCLGSSVGTASA